MITKNMVVTLKYNVTDSDGNVIDEGQEPMIYLHGGYGRVFQPIEDALEGKSVGDMVTVKLQPAEAFGEYDAELVYIVPVEELPEPLKIGMQIEGNTEDGNAEPIYATVTDIADGKAVLDANHPLAGMALVFICTVENVQQATTDEIAEAQGR